jgi:hypothetical protein
VAVVQHDQGAAAAGLDLLDHRVGEQLVDGQVAVLERGVLPPGQLGGEGEPVEPVLQEPQQGVGDHGVEVVVGPLVDLDQAQPNGGSLALLRGGLGLVEEPRLGLQGDAERLVVVLADHGGVLVGGGRAHPAGVGAVRNQARERRDQSTGLPAARTGPCPVAGKRHRPTVRQQHHRQVWAGARHGNPLPPLLRAALVVPMTASARSGWSAKAARSRSDIPPQTPYRSPYRIA